MLDKNRITMLDVSNKLDIKCINVQMCNVIYK